MMWIKASAALIITIAAVAALYKAALWLYDASDGKYSKKG